ncbi:unnamed protein product, partial [Rotaria magnacalcarata]
CTADDPKYRPAAIEIEKTLELYSQKKNTVFIKFYEKIHRAATEFIRTKFPSEFLEGSTSVQGVKVKTDSDNTQQIACRLQ